ncbi:MAG: alpha-amylase family glycosyl hydrolase [Bacteriovorax sp.]|jgi:1,4-alpha-glucan branching enzyme
MRIFGKLLCFFTIIFLSRQALARIPFKDDWTQSFYTDDNSSYLTLYPDGFKQLIRVNSVSCNQIKRIDIVFRDSSKNLLSEFKTIAKSSAPKIYGLKLDDYCWYEVVARGLNSINGIKYVLKIEDSGSTPYFFKGITSSLVPLYRITQDPNIDAWIELGPFGATPVVGGGVFYKIWEPLSEEVHLFINDDKPIKLFSDFALNDERRFHYAYVKNSSLKDKYHFQFLKNGEYENLEVANFKTFSPVKVDPMARELTYEAKGGRFNGYINPRAIVAKDNEYVWKNDSVLSTMSNDDYNNWIIYQLWPLTFNPKQIDGAYVQGKFTDIIPKIPYLSNLGVNAVELLPVNESRFNASWGYALDSLIVLESTLGTKADMKKLIDELHAGKLRVLFDVVINHVNNNLLREPVNPVNHTSKFYGGDTPWGPKPRFESVWVRKWITDSLLHMMTEYHLDGFRFDMTDSIFNGTRGGYRFLQELMYLIRVNGPRFYNSAEQLPNDIWVTYPISENGLGFNAQWNDRFKNFFELEFDNYSETNRAVDLTHLSNSLLGFSDHEMSPGVFYHFGNPQRTVNYLGSHDFIGNKDPMIRIVSKYKNEEQEDSNIFSRVNPLEEEGDLRIPFRTIHNQFSHALARLSYGILFTKPGAALFYQGEELAQDLNIQNEWAYVNALKDNRFPSKNVNINKYVRSHRMTWHYYELANGRKDPLLNFTTDEDEKLFSGHMSFFKEMINFKKSNPEINNRDAENVKIDNYTKIVTYELNTSRDSYFVVGNFNADNGGAWIQFPGNGQVWWSEIINSSDSKFGSDSEVYQNIFSNLGGRRNLLRLKGPGFYIFKAVKSPGVSKKLYFRSSAFKWLANETTELKANPLNAEEMMTEIEFSKFQIIDFKLGTKNWEIDLGKSADVRTLSYIPFSPNMRVSVEEGKYLFRFNINNFTYSFEKL